MSCIQCSSDWHAKPLQAHVDAAVMMTRLNVLVSSHEEGLGERVVTRFSL